MQDQKSYSPKVPLWGVLIIIFIPLGLWYAWGLFGVRSFLLQLKDLGVTDEQIGSLGQIGDIFGGVNALFAALAFACVAIGAYYQASSWLLLKRQHDQQSFEPLFFQLLQLFRSVTVSKSLSRPPAWQSLNDRFWDEASERPVSFLAEIARSEVLDELHRGALTDIQEVVEHLDARFGLIIRANENVLSIYFRSLFHVFKTIDMSEMSEQSKISYANIARSILTPDDILLIALNCRRDKESEFIQLIEKYGLLKHARRIPPSTPFDVGNGLTDQVLGWRIEGDFTEDLGLDRYMMRDTFHPHALMGSAMRKNTTSRAHS